MRSRDQSTFFHKSDTLKAEKDANDRLHSQGRGFRPLRETVHQQQSVGEEQERFLATKGRLSLLVVNDVRTEMVLHLFLSSFRPMLLLDSLRPRPSTCLILSLGLSVPPLGLLFDLLHIEKFIFQVLLPVLTVDSPG